MGYCVPAAMGAKVGQPDKIVWGIDGDGCFQMTTRSSPRALEGIPIKIAVINNQSLGMSGSGRPCSIRPLLQHGSQNQPHPDFGKLAEAMGCVGLRAEDLRTSTL